MQKSQTRITVLLTLAMSLATQLPTYAAGLTSADEARLASYETSIFGAPRPQMAEETRLRALENNLFGKEKTGKPESRLDAMAKLLGKNAVASKFNPPMAGQLDRSQFAPQPQASPDTVSPAATADSAPPQATANDSAKQLLRTALQKHAEGNVAEAENIFKQVLRVDPKNADANFSLGTMAEERGDLTGATRFYKVANASNPSDLEIQDALSAVQTKVKQKQAAQQVAQQQQMSSQRKNELRGMAEEAATAYKAGDFNTAIAKLSKVAAAEPRDANAQFALAQAWRGKGDYNRAQGYLNAALAIDPGNALYQSTGRDMQQEAQSGGGQGGSQVAGGQQGGGQQGGGQMDQQTAYNDQRPTGEITPFAPDTRSGRGGLGGLGGGLGGLGGGLAGLFGGGGNNNSIDYGAPDSSGSSAYGWSSASSSGGSYRSGGSRATSALMGGLVGAFIGGATSRSMGMPVKQGALQGGLSGAIQGLLKF